MYYNKRRNNNIIYIHKTKEHITSARRADESHSAPAGDLQTEPFQHLLKTARQIYHCRICIDK